MQHILYQKKTKNLDLRTEIFCWCVHIQWLNLVLHITTTSAEVLTLVGQEQSSVIKYEQQITLYHHWACSFLDINADWYKTQSLGIQAHTDSWVRSSQHKICDFYHTSIMHFASVPIRTPQGFTNLYRKSLL